MLCFANENNDPRQLGALDVYKNKQALLFEYEPWYEKIGHIVFDSNGICYKIVSNDDVLFLEKLKSKVHPKCVARFIQYYESGCDQNILPDTVDLIEDHHDYIVEAPRPVKQKWKSFFAQLKFWK